MQDPLEITFSAKPLSIFNDGPLILKIFEQDVLLGKSGSSDRKMWERLKLDSRKSRTGSLSGIIYKNNKEVALCSIKFEDFLYALYGDFSYCYWELLDSGGNVFGKLFAEGIAKLESNEANNSLKIDIAAAAAQARDETYFDNEISSSGSSGAKPSINKAKKANGSAKSPKVKKNQTPNECDTQMNFNIDSKGTVVNTKIVMSPSANAALSPSAKLNLCIANGQSISLKTSLSIQSPRCPTESKMSPQFKIKVDCTSSKTGPDISSPTRAANLAKIKEKIEKAHNIAGKSDDIMKKIGSNKQSPSMNHEGIDTVKDQNFDIYCKKPNLLEPPNIKNLENQTRNDLTFKKTPIVTALHKEMQNKEFESPSNLYNYSDISNAMNTSNSSGTPIDASSMHNKNINFLNASTPINRNLEQKTTFEKEKVVEDENKNFKKDATSTKESSFSDINDVYLGRDVFDDTKSCSDYSNKLNREESAAHATNKNQNISQSDFQITDNLEKIIDIEKHPINSDYIGSKSNIDSYVQEDLENLDFIDHGKDASETKRYDQSLKVHDDNLQEQNMQESSSSLSSLSDMGTDVYLGGEQDKKAENIQDLSSIIEKSLEKLNKIEIQNQEIKELKDNLDDSDKIVSHQIGEERLKDSIGNIAEQDYSIDRTPSDIMKKTSAMKINDENDKFNFSFENDGKRAKDPSVDINDQSIQSLLRNDNQEIDIKALHEMLSKFNKFMPHMEFANKFLRRSNSSINMSHDYETTQKKNWSSDDIRNFKNMADAFFKTDEPERSQMSRDMSSIEAEQSHSKKQFSLLHVDNIKNIFDSSQSDEISKEKLALKDIIGNEHLSNIGGSRNEVIVSPALVRTSGENSPFTSEILKENSLKNAQNFQLGKYDRDIFENNFKGDSPILKIENAKESDAILDDLNSSEILSVNDSLQNLSKEKLKYSTEFDSNDYTNEALQELVNISRCSSFKLVKEETSISPLKAQEFDTPINLILQSEDVPIVNSILHKSCNKKILLSYSHLSRSAVQLRKIKERSLPMYQERINSSHDSPSRAILSNQKKKFVNDEEKSTEEIHRETFLFLDIDEEQLSERGSCQHEILGIKNVKSHLFENEQEMSKILEEDTNCLINENFIIDDLKKSSSIQDKENIQNSNYANVHLAPSESERYKTSEYNQQNSDGVLENMNRSITKETENSDKEVDFQDANSNEFQKIHLNLGLTNNMSNSFSNSRDGNQNRSLINNTCKIKSLDNFGSNTSGLFTNEESSSPRAFENMDASVKKDKAFTHEQLDLNDAKNSSFLSSHPNFLGECPTDTINSSLSKSKDCYENSALVSDVSKMISHDNCGANKSGLSSNEEKCILREFENLNIIKKNGFANTNEQFLEDDSKESKSLNINQSINGIEDSLSKTIESNHKNSLINDVRRLQPAKNDELQSQDINHLSNKCINNSDAQILLNETFKNRLINDVEECFQTNSDRSIHVSGLIDNEFLTNHQNIDISTDSKKHSRLEESEKSKIQIDYQYIEKSDVSFNSQHFDNQRKHNGSETTLSHNEQPHNESLDKNMFDITDRREDNHHSLHNLNDFILNDKYDFGINIPVTLEETNVNSENPNSLITSQTPNISFSNVIGKLKSDICGVSDIVNIEFDSAQHLRNAKDSLYVNKDNIETSSYENAEAFNGNDKEFLDVLNLRNKQGSFDISKQIAIEGSKSDISGVSDIINIELNDAQHLRSAQDSLYVNKDNIERSSCDNAETSNGNDKEFLDVLNLRNKQGSFDISKQIAIEGSKSDISGVSDIVNIEFDNAQHLRSARDSLYVNKDNIERSSCDNAETSNGNDKEFLDVLNLRNKQGSFDINKQTAIEASKSDISGVSDIANKNKEFDDVQNSRDVNSSFEMNREITVKPSKIDVTGESKIAEKDLDNIQNLNNVQNLSDMNKNKVSETSSTDVTPELYNSLIDEILCKEYESSFITEPPSNSSTICNDTPIGYSSHIHGMKKALQNEVNISKDITDNTASIFVFKNISSLGIVQNDENSLNFENTSMDYFEDSEDITFTLYSSLQKMPLTKFLHSAEFLSNEDFDEILQEIVNVSKFMSYTHAQEEEIFPKKFRAKEVPVPFKDLMEIEHIPVSTSFIHKSCNKKIVVSCTRLSRSKYLYNYPEFGAPPTYQDSINQDSPCKLIS